MGAHEIHKTIWMERGHNTTYIKYSYVAGEGECSLALHPMCNYRDYHGVTRGSFDWQFQVESLPGGCKVTAYEGASPLWLTTNPQGDFTQTGVWYWNFIYRREVERGFNKTEDLYLPGIVRAHLSPGQSVTLIASSEPPEATGLLIADSYEREQDRQAGLLRKAGVEPQSEDIDAADPHLSHQAFKAQLVRAADTFFVKRNIKTNGMDELVPTVIAGYHWFTDWGRDTMISLPGLALPTGRTDEAAETVRAFTRFIHDGLIPNNFPDTDASPHYNTADGTLWMFQAVAALADSAGDYSLAEELYPLLSDIIAWHVRGTSYNIHVDERDGLLYAGKEGVQLTWMDAKVDDWVVTPRTGKPVEINALWFNALEVMIGLGATLGRKATPGKKGKQNFKALAKRSRDSFRERFWYAEGGYLYDVIDGPDGDDNTMRPNQVLALSLQPGLMTKQQARRALSNIRRELLTPYGLRTLSPDDAHYKPTYKGDRYQRDGAYHQGTVWTWLLGPYFDAVLAVDGIESARAEFERIMPVLRVHLSEAGLGTISEIFDADAPHAPKGCLSQAWSVAEVLRILHKIYAEQQP